MRGAMWQHVFLRGRGFVSSLGCQSLSRHPAWMLALAHGLHHQPYCIEALQDGCTVGLLPLAFVESWLFGRFLVGLPYLNTGGVLATDSQVAGALVNRAVALADELDVRYLELRHEQALDHPALQHQLTSKVHMRLPLPGTSEALWSSFKPKVRNQIRKGERLTCAIDWGNMELLGEFYDVFAHTMRDLGTPVFGRPLFQAILSSFAGQAELCVLRLDGKPVAAALLTHGAGTTEVLSASSLHALNSTNVNMAMYWHLLQRAIARGQTVFDFGRSTVDGSTFRFKKQWGAVPEPAVWQYYLRKGAVGDMRPESGRYARMVALWRRLPVAVTRIVGPRIVRGIP